MSGLEFISQIYLSGNGLEPTEPSQVAWGELGWMAASEAQVLYYHLSRHVHCLCLLIIFYIYLCVIARQLKTEKLQFRFLL